MTVFDRAPSFIKLEMEVLAHKFQRDLNRIIDTDKNTRRRGLQNLLDSLPWSNNNERPSLVQFINTYLFDILLSSISDPVEKCREISIQLTSKVLSIIPELKKNKSYIEKLIPCLCNRLNDTPFPEPSEELRYELVQIIKLILTESLSPTDVTIIITSLGKCLSDSFPNVKRLAAECITIIAQLYSENMRMSYKAVLEPLVANGLHQHSKTRIITLKV